MPQGEVNKAKTHCPKGHPLSGDNLLTAKLRVGKRECRTCHNERRRIARKARREQADA